MIRTPSWLIAVALLCTPLALDARRQALTDNLVAFWSLEEASGSRADSAGASALTDNNTVTTATGKVGMAADFEADNSESLSITDNAALSMGDIDFTFGGWVNWETVPDSGDARLFVSKGDSSSPEYELRYQGPNAQFQFRLASAAAFTNYNFVGASSFGAASAGTWYFVVARYDATADEASISVNAGTVNSGVHTGGAYNGTAAFQLGRVAGVGSAFDGMLDQVGVWKRRLSDAEVTTLYNSGNGLSFAAIGGGGGGARPCIIGGGLLGPGCPGDTR